MTLTTHAVVGAGLASLVPSHPELGFVLGFMSHFLLDAIPHWDYSLKAAQKNEQNLLESTLKFNRETISDLVKIAVDGVLGILLVVLIFMPTTSWFLFVVLVGAFGGMLPDGIQFLYFKFGGSFLRKIQYFHVMIMHARANLKDYPIPGILIQIGIIVVIYALYNL